MAYKKCKNGGKHMGLFTPQWMNKDVKKRAAAMAKLTEDELMAIVCGERASEVIRAEALAHLQDVDSLEKIVYEDTIPAKLRASALKSIKSDDILKRIVGDPRTWGLWKNAISQMKNDQMLAEIIIQYDDYHIWECAVNNMQNRELIVETALRLNSAGFTDQSIKRLKSLDDDERIKELLLAAPELGSFQLSNYIGFYENQPTAIMEIFHKAKCEDLRLTALSELAKRDLSPELQSQAHALLRQKLQLHQSGANNSDQIVRLMDAFPNGIALMDEERIILYSLLTKKNQELKRLRYWSAKFLASCDDMVGLAVLPFFKKLLWSSGQAQELDEHEYKRLLNIPADLALDFLIQFKENAFSSTGRRAPSLIMSCCAKAICLLHEKGHASERIERELPQMQSFSIAYDYQDSEGDIRSDTDNFTVAFWKNRIC
jgi:hypothetical protein